MFRGISLGKTGFVVVGLLGLGLLTGQPASPDLVDQDLPAATVDGAELYAKHCSSCHGSKGGGDGSLASAFNPPPTDLTDGETMAALTDEAILEAMSSGKGSPKSRPIASKPRATWSGTACTLPMVTPSTSGTASGGAAWCRR